MPSNSHKFEYKNLQIKLKQLGDTDFSEEPCTMYMYKKNQDTTLLSIVYLSRWQTVW